MTAGPRTGSVGTQLKLLYDGWNRQSGYDANGDGDTLDSGDYTYRYDGTGRRITKFQDTANDGTNAAGTGEEYYLNGSNQVLEVRFVGTASGVKTINANPRERYQWDESYVDAPAMTEIDSNTDGTRDNRLWPTFDANHNVTAVLTDSGVTVERYAYTPYGERIILNGDQNYANTAADPDGAEWTVDTTGSDYGVVVGFQGKRVDAEAGSAFFNARYQGPLIGFLSRDPWLDRYQDGMDLFNFEHTNPVRCSDPSGIRRYRALGTTLGVANRRRPSDTYFWPGDYMTDMLRQHSHVQNTVKSITEQLA